MASDGSGGSSSGSASSKSCLPDFDAWVKSNGGDEDFLKVLHSHGFKSTLSLSKRF